MGSLYGSIQDTISDPHEIHMGIHPRSMQGSKRKFMKDPQIFAIRNLCWGNSRLARAPGADSGSNPEGNSPNSCSDDGVLDDFFLTRTCGRAPAGTVSQSGSTCPPACPPPRLAPPPCPPACPPALSPRLVPPSCPPDCPPDCPPALSPRLSSRLVPLLVLPPYPPALSSRVAPKWPVLAPACGGQPSRWPPTAKRTS